jgi:hypothetical protein
MAKIERKTTENEGSVKGFLNTVEEKSKRKDSIKIAKIKEKKITQCPAKMRETAIIVSLSTITNTTGTEKPIC